MLLCTANQCRSPMAEVLLRHHLAEAGVDATVASAGLLPGGAPATAPAAAAMADRGLDLSAHRSRQLDRQLVDAADLIVGMAREHIREVAVLDGDALRRSFTLKELVRAAERTSPPRADEPLARWLQRAADDRDMRTLLGAGHDPAYDVEDPIGRGPRHYEAAADELDTLLRQLVNLVFPLHAKRHPETPAAQRRPEPAS